jgi:alpha-galactosidase
MSTLIWGASSLRLQFSYGTDASVSLGSISTAAGFPAEADPSTGGPTVEQPLVELSAMGHGRFPGSFRHVDTVLSRSLRYIGHEETRGEDVAELRIIQAEEATGLQVTSVFVARDGISGFRTWTEVTVAGSGSYMLDFVSTLATGAYLVDSATDVDELALVYGDNDWVAESRWLTRSLREMGLARIDRELQHQPPRSRCVVTNRGSWSTGEKLPTGVLLSRTFPYALAWQIEHNGPWLYELGETREGAYLLLSGPTDQEHQWSTEVAEGTVFISVPASIVVTRGGLDEAFAALTDQRRAIRSLRPVDSSLPVVFNDFMNTLMGDPTTDKLLPLIDAAAEAGADYFCIDAGWYARGNWWDTVGEWLPAPERFPGGITEVIDHIRERGMVAGLWLEPEVIGVNSPLALTLPDDAFFYRRGIRVAEHGRHLLDLRSPAARAHLDSVVDRLVADYGVGFFKMDYNTMTGAGSDLDGQAPGQGLLEHNRALLRWLDAIQLRHPNLLIENCASGAMRMDYAMMSRLHLQSTSDQQDPVKYATIAAAAPASLLPEQAGNWAYPQPGMEPELLTLCLANAILGRMYLSGYLNAMSPQEIKMVREAVAAQKVVLADIERSHAFWPLGLPDWEDPWVCLGLDVGDHGAYLTLWHRPGAGERVVLRLPELRGRQLRVEPFFPRSQAGWDWSWVAAAGELSVTVSIQAPSARVLKLEFAR